MPNTTIHAPALAAFLADQTPPYDDEVVTEAFFLGAAAGIKAMGLSFAEEPPGSTFSAGDVAETTRYAVQFVAEDFPVLVKYLGLVK